MADAAVGKEKCGDQRLVSLPLSRIRVIMKSSPEVSSINQEALVLTAKATVSGRRGDEKGGRGHQPPFGLRTQTPWPLAALRGPSAASSSCACAPRTSPPLPRAQLRPLRRSLARAVCAAFASLSLRSQRPLRPASRVIFRGASRTRSSGFGCVRELRRVDVVREVGLALTSRREMGGGRGFSKLPGQLARLSRALQPSGHWRQSGFTQTTTVTS